METKPATLYQLLALRDALLARKDKNATTACYNLIDILLQQADKTCICVDFINFNPDPVPNPDCPLHGALRDGTEL